MIMAPLPYKRAEALLSVSVVYVGDSVCVPIYSGSQTQGTVMPGLPS